MDARPKRSRFSGCLTALGIASALLFIAIRGFWYFAGPVIDQNLLRKVVPGASKEDVVSILGEPSVVHDDGWIYYRWGNPGWVEIYFGSGRHVLWVNDESPILPEHGHYGERRD